MINSFSPFLLYVKATCTKEVSYVRDSSNNSVEPSWGQAEFDFIMWVYKVQSPVNDLIVGLPGDAIEQFDGASGALYIQ